tara:strand:+ start:10430 stop:10780 length:351 start_codon:yes stop_codon:yes gene_type:complete
MNKEELLDSVKKWISLDDKIKNLGKEIKETREEKKDLTNVLLDTMKNNEIDCFDLAGGNKLIYQKTKTKKTLSKKHLLDALISFTKNEQQAKNMSEFILNSREDQVKENIRRKIPK